MCKATLLKSHFGIGVTPVNWLHIFRTPLWRAASVGLAIRRKRITDRKDWRKTEKVYLGETMATQTGNPHLYGRTEIRRQRNTKYFWEKPRKLWRVIGAYRCQYYRKRYKQASFHSSKCWIICHDKIFCYRWHLFWLIVSIQDPCKHIVKVDPRSLWCYLHKVKGKLICSTIEIPKFIFS